MIRFLKQHKHTIIYGRSLAVLLFVLKWLELRLIILHNALEIYIALIALFFTGLGIWLALKLSTPKVRTVVIEKPAPQVTDHEHALNHDQLEKLGLSKRELEVLQLMADGLSNQEIASRLYLSVSTVKTHSSKLFEKMNVGRRTQAVDRAKKNGNN